MATRALLTIPKRILNGKKGVVILDLEEYKKLLASSVPTYYLKGKAAERLDRLVKRGLGDHRKGKTRIIKSLADLD